MSVLMLLALPLITGTTASSASTATVASTTRAGGTLAYLESVARATPDPITDIFVVNADGSGRRRVTHDQVDAQRLEWSPDRRRFVFSTITRASSSSIWVLKRDGSKRRRLTPLGNWVKPRWSTIWPSWSPNGRRIFYSVLTEGVPGDQGIYVMNADGTHRRRLTRKHDFLLSWSLDKRRIAFVRAVLPNPQALERPELWVMNADGSGQRRLYWRLGHRDRFELSPNWRKLVIDRRRGSVRELYVMNVNGSRAHRLARGFTSRLNFSWSPTGREIAFERGEAIWVATADAQKQRRLIARGASPLWSPDGRLIAFASRPGISVMNSYGGARRLVIPWEGEITNIRWAPAS